MSNLLESFGECRYSLFEAVFETDDHSQLKDLGWEVVSTNTTDQSDSYDFTDDFHEAILKEIETGDFYSFTARTQSYNGTDIDWPMKKVEKKTKTVTYFE